jgi:uncharacterized membrane protein YhaH (DUF805 family)
LVQISTIFGVTLDYLLKTDHTEEAQQSNSYYVSREMIEGFLSYKRQGAKRIAIGVSLIVLSNSFISVLTENQPAMILYLMTLVSGVAVLVWHIFQQNRYKEIGSKQLLFDDDTLKDFRQEHDKNRKRYVLMIIVAVIIFIVSPQVKLSALEYSDNSFGLALSGVLDAVWISLVILAGFALHAERIIAQNTEYMKKKSKEGKYAWIYIALPVTALAVAIGIFTNVWSPVVPIIALFCALLVTVCKILLEGRNKNE